MGRDYTFSIQLEGPPHALKMVEKFCTGRVECRYGLFKENDREEYESCQLVIGNMAKPPEWDGHGDISVENPSGTCLKYEVDGHSWLYHLEAFEAFINLFPGLNITYFEEDDEGLVFCDVLRNGTITEYSISDSHACGYVLKAVDFEKHVGYCKGLPRIRVPNKVYKLDGWQGQRARLTQPKEDLIKDMKKWGGSAEDYLTILLREDSLGILREIGDLSSTGQYFGKSGITPLMFAIKIGKVEEFRLMKTYNPEWLDIRASNYNRILDYCVMTRDADLYHEIAKELEGDIYKHTWNVDETADKYCVELNDDDPYMIIVKELTEPE